MSRPFQPFRRPAYALPGLLLSATLAFAGLSSAAGSIAEQLSAPARAEWTAALQLYEAGNYADARARFERAFDLSGNPRTLFNVGLCWRDLNRYAAAIEAWERQLRYPLSKEIARVTKAAIDNLKPFVSTMILSVDEPGASVVVDGVPVGTTPLPGPVRVDIGARTIEVSKPGFEMVRRQLEVISGQAAQLQVDLQHTTKTGMLSVHIDGPPAAELLLDGRVLSARALSFEGPVPAGEHTIEATAEGFVTTRQSLQVRYEEAHQVTLALARSVAEGKVRVVTGYHDAMIYVDGKRVALGAWEGRLPVGGHRLRVMRPSFEDYRAEIALAPHQVRQIEVDLVRERSWAFWGITVATVVGGGILAATRISEPTERPVVTGSLGNVTF